MLTQEEHYITELLRVVLFNLKNTPNNPQKKGIVSTIPF